MATIEIYRPFGYFGCARNLKVWVDGILVGNVHTKRTELFKVSDAVHSVQVSMDWCKSVPMKVDLSNGGTSVLAAKTLWFPASLFIAFIRPSRAFFVVSTRA